MGALLDRWMQENQQNLARLQPGGGAMLPPMGGQPQPAFGEGAMLPPTQPAFGAGPPPMAGPVSVRQTPGAEVGNFQRFQPTPMPEPPAFAAGEPAPGGEPLGSMVAGAFEDRVPTEEEPEEKPKAKNGEVHLPEEGEEFSASDALEQVPDSVDKAIKELEKMTDTPIEEHYQNTTGSPPPSGMSKTEMGNFLFEFGLNLLAQPGGMSEAEEFGKAAQQTIGGRRARAAGRQQAEVESEERRAGRLTDLAKLGLKKREIEALEAGGPTGSYADFVGSDGYMYTYDKRTGVGKRVVGPDGKPVKSPPKMGSGANAESVQRFNAVMDNWRRRSEILGIEFGGQYELKARDAAEAALRGLRPSEMSDETRRSKAMDWAQAVTDTTEYKFATKEDQQTMMETARRDAYNYLRYGEQGEANTPIETGGAPDASQLQPGMARQVTDEDGNVSWWTLDENGQPRKVDAAEME